MRRFLKNCQHLCIYFEIMDLSEILIMTRTVMVTASYNESNDRMRYDVKKGLENIDICIYWMRQMIYIMLIYDGEFNDKFVGFG